ncbi:WD repeat-containing protein 44 [Leucoraja erinacea]|uniref:WD repeat-containing protein 44 n=1 Tax=Leucoraja erinaceus TaxID=7782 RepID=UPI002458F848|nr:WD repeat-containing protein 44 [Leucoraja erinacea]
MASDTSDAEEFYDAAEEVNSGPSPAASPAKIIISTKEQIDNEAHRDFSFGQDHKDEVADQAEEEEQQKGKLKSASSETSGEDSSVKSVGVTLTVLAEADLLSNISGLLNVDQQLCAKPKSLTEQSSSDVKPEKPEVLSETQTTLPSSQTISAVTFNNGDTTSTKVSTPCPENSSTDCNSSSQQPSDKREEDKGDILEHNSEDRFALDDEFAAEQLQRPKLPRQMSAEPDIVASTKKPIPIRPPPPGSSIPPPRPPPPVRPAPPPRKKKSETALDVHNPLGIEGPLDPEASIGLVSPTSAIENLTKELQHSLDLASATSGDKVVTAQENGKGESASDNPEAEEIGPQRPRSNSGRELTDEEILASVMVKNLDTGEEIPLNMAEEKLPKGLNPLTLHIMRRTKEYVSNDAAQSDDEEKIHPTQTEPDGHKIKQKTNQLKKFLGKSVKRAKHLAEEYGEKAVNKVKSVRDEVFHMDQDDASSSDDEGMPYTRPCKFKAAHSFKGPFDFDQIKMVQDLSGEHMVSCDIRVRHACPHHCVSTCVPTSLRVHITAGVSFPEPYSVETGTSAQPAHVDQHAPSTLVPPACVVWMPSGSMWTWLFAYLLKQAAGLEDHLPQQYGNLKNAWDYFKNMRIKYNTEGRVSPSPSQESLSSSKSDTDTAYSGTEDSDPEDKNAPFRQRPFCKYKGHTADLLDLSWSKNYFLLSSSMDKTVRLWHISRRECLCCFQHIDFVTAIAFHPRDDRYFLSGSLDGKLRLWNIPDKKVALWNEIDGQTKLITAANFCQNGKYAVIGTYDGRCIFYDTEHLKYHTQIHVRSTRGRNRVGRKITGIEPLPGENKILVTSNDSRIRLYDLRDLSISMKYKGYMNSSSQIKASFSHDYTYIMSGSEDSYFYIWSTYHDVSKFTSVRRDRNDFWEGIKAHNAVVTSAIFAPNPSLMLSDSPQAEKAEGDGLSINTDNIPSGALKADITEVLLSADFTGAIKVFMNKKKKIN